VRIVRWVAVPLVAIAGYYLSVWLFFQSAVSCLHLGPRPPGLCSDWWYASHSWIAVASCTLVGFAGSVLLPTMVAPRHKRIVTLVSLVAAAVFYVWIFDLRVWAWVVPMLIGLSGIGAFLLPDGRKSGVA